jgi:UDP-N-acetyl-D-glucosamine dehydrogenase
VNIAMINEMKVLLAEMDIDVWEVVDAAATKPFGFQAFYPGPGLGGHCIPIDPYYLTWKAKEAGMTTRFIELAGEINHSMPAYVVNRMGLALNDHGKAFKGSKILVLGLAYKPDVDDVRESPSLELIVLLKALGADVSYNDPHVATTHRMRNYDLAMESVPIDEGQLAGYDCVVVATHHQAYDWQQIADQAPLVVDTRGALREVRGPRDHIYPA